MLGLPFSPRIVPMHPLTPMQQVKRNDELRRIAIARRMPAAAPVPYRPAYHQEYTPSYRAPYRPPASYRPAYAPAFRYRNDWTRAQNERERIRLQTLQAQLLQQQTQQQALQQQQSAQMLQTAAPPQVATSPGSPEADLTPAQDASAAAAEGGDEPAHPHSNHKMLLFGGIVVIAGIGAYAMLHKKKSSSKP